MAYLQQAIADGHIRFTGEGKNEKIHYVAANHSERWSDPEEKIRASYFVELITDYLYSPDRIEIEVTVPRRTPEDHADIVIYEDDEKKKPYLVVECKKDGISDAEYKQAIEQAFGNANSLRSQYAIVVAGNTRTAFDVSGFKPSEREKNVIADIPVKYGKAPKYRYIKGDTKNDLRIISKEDLIITLAKAHDTIWQGGKLSPTTAFDEVAKLLFCKLQDEKERTLTKKGDAYKFQIGTHEDSVTIFNRINDIYQYAKQKDAEVFKEDIKLESKIVYSVVEHLQGINFSKTDLDTKGVAFERFMEDFFKGKMGQFFTPREIIRFCVNMIDPQEDKLVLDPACGSGGFLLHCLDHIRAIADKEYVDGGDDHYKLWHDFAKDNLYGIEINDQIARICKMNLIIHDDGHTNVISYDALENLEKIKNIHQDIFKNNFDVILTNPPFGANIKLKEHPYLANYFLGKNKNNQKSEILFIERCIEFLKPGTGMLCMVLPDSILINKTLQGIRDYILEKTQIIAIVSLPDYTFTHYGANVKSSLLFARVKKPKERPIQYDIFLATAEAIGYTASGKKDRNNDLPKILEYFQEFTKTSKLSTDKEYKSKIYLVKPDELIGKRLDPKGYSPIFKEIKKQLQKSSLPKKKLSELLLENQAGDWGKDQYDEDVAEDDILCYVLRNTNFDNYFNLNFDDVALRYISKRKVKALSLKQNDILVEKSGGSPVQPVGRVAIIRELPTDKPVVFSNFLQMIRVDEKEAMPQYVYTYLRVLWHLGYMEYIQNQTTGIKNLLLDEFFELEIPIIKNSDIQETIAADYIRTLEDAKKEISQQYLAINSSRKKTIEIFLKS